MHRQSSNERAIERTTALAGKQREGKRKQQGTQVPNRKREWARAMARATAQERTEGEGIFSNFLGDEVKVPYRDGRQLKIARGTLVSVSNGFVKIVGSLGTIIINTRNIEKMSRLSVKRNSKSNAKGGKR